MNQIDTKRLIGLDENQASRLIAIAGGQMLVVLRDGIPLNNRTDRRTDRVCVDVMFGKVTKAVCI